MIRLLAALVIACALFSPVRADDSEKYCTQPKEMIVPHIVELMNRGIPVEQIDGFKAKLYLDAAKEYVENMPDLGDVQIILVKVEGTGVKAVIFKKDKWCAILTLNWEAHQKVMAKVKGRDA